MNRVLLGCLLLMICSCKKGQKQEVETVNKKEVEILSREDSNKIAILNFGTFHMGFTPDANKTEFNEHDRENQKRVHEIAQKLAEFKPTVIVVEESPSGNIQLQQDYAAYVNDPNMFFKKPSEVELLAFELGRLCGTKEIYGIDHRMKQYNYNIGNEIKNDIDSIWHDQYCKNPRKYHPEINVNRDSLSLFERLKLMNRDAYLDYLININANILTHAGTKDGFEGADEAALFYQRNLRMYSNLNRLNLKKDDRVFILMGATHTAFFRGFLKGSPKFEMVNTFDYLN